MPLNLMVIFSILPGPSVLFYLIYLSFVTLGRYGDAINPWGDILTIARAWCASSPKAKVAFLK